MKSLAARSLIGLLILAVLGGCATAPPKVRVERDPATDFTRFATFAFLPAPAGGYTAVRERLLDQRVRAAVTAELTARGYRLDEAAPELRIAYDTTSQEKTKSSPFRIGIGVGGIGGNVGGGVSVGTSPVDKYLEGTLAIDAVDAARNVQIWHGSLTGKVKDQTLEEASIRRVVATILADFPRREAAAP
jgi:hypothetical protein